MPYFLPRATERLVEQQVGRCQNLALLLDKYLPRNVIGENKNKGGWLKDMKVLDQSPLNLELAHNAYLRWVDTTSARGARHFSGKVDWRMVIGLGGETVLETDLTLHHLYGIPFIPGSALKGLTRAYAAQEKKEVFIPSDKPDEAFVPSLTIEKDHETIQRIFGKQKETGTVIFFDALPQNGEARFELDIMNAHYPDYYSEGKVPTNDQNPNPVTFLTVARTTFIFALAPRLPEEKQHKEDMKLAVTWLGEALQNYGVGGKTGAGYGYFNNITPLLSLAKENDHTKENVQQISEPHERPNIPVFKEGQRITGIVLDPKKDQEVQRRVHDGEASACLRYKEREISTRKLLIVIPTGYAEAKEWAPGNMKHCFFIREEIQGSCTVLLCRP